MTIQQLLRMFRRPPSRCEKAPDYRPGPAGQQDFTVDVPDTYQETAKKLIDWSVIQSVGYENAVVKTKTKGAHQDIVAFYNRFNRELRKRGYPFYAFEFVRSHERQRKLYEKGVTKARPGKSPHNHGMAVDIVHYGRYWDLTKKEWDFIGAIGKEVARKMNLRITWGGDWSFWDPAHWELTDWRLMKNR